MSFLSIGRDGKRPLWLVRASRGAKELLAQGCQVCFKGYLQSGSPMYKKVKDFEDSFLSFPFNIPTTLSEPLPRLKLLPELGQIQDMFCLPLNVLVWESPTITNSFAALILFYRPKEKGIKLNIEKSVGSGIGIYVKHSSVKLYSSRVTYIIIVSFL